MRYFDKIETLGELKKKFRGLALEHHPDHGGDTRIMQEIISEYQRLVKILLDVKASPSENPAPSAPSKASPSEKCEAPRFHCPYQPTTAGGSNPHLLRLATPAFSHKEMCLLAKSLFVYAGLCGKEDLREFYRKLCRIIDPGQCRPYCDYSFNRKVAMQSLKLMRTKILKRTFTSYLWNLFKTSQANLQKAA